jgi:hypothetical protein
MLPQTEMISSDETCVSKVDGLNSSNISFNFWDYLSHNLTSIILRKMELSELRENSLSIFADISLNVLNISGTLINLTGNPHTYECFLSQDINENINITSLNCLSQGDLSTEERSNTTLPENVVIFGIYACSVFVAVVVVLVITYVVGKPEPDEFWWEDKLEKRNY